MRTRPLLALAADSVAFGATALFKGLRGDTHRRQHMRDRHSPLTQTARIPAFFLVSTLVALHGCAATLSVRQRALLDEALSNSAPTECDVSSCPDKWAMAKVWIVKHSSMKIQVVDDTIIDTYNPIDQVAPFAFRALRVPKGPGKYGIEINVICAKPARCAPFNPKEIAAFFYYYLNSGKDISTESDFYPEGTGGPKPVGQSNYPDKPMFRIPGISRGKP